MGAPTIALEQFAKLADTRLDRVLENYLPAYQQVRSQIFGSMPSDKSFIELFTVGTMQNIPKSIGKIQYLDLNPGFYTRIEPAEYLAGIQMTRKMRDDNQFQVFKNLQGDMVEAYGRTQEEDAVKAFALAFSATWEFMLSEEGLSLCNSAHLTKSGVSTSTGFSNITTGALSPTSIAANRIIFRRFRTDIGKIYNSEPDTLVVPESLYDAACQAVGYVPGSGASSALDPTSANHMVNVLYKGFKVIPWRYLDDYSTKSWFMIDSKAAKKQLIWDDRVKPDTDTRIDWDTKNIQQSIYARHGWGFGDWRWILGAQVS
jgi:hypothetical protein